MRIVVVFGGVSEEREVSLCSGACVCAALRERGHAVLEMPLDTSLPSGAQWEQMRAADAVFLALHGGAGEDGRVQESLEAAGIFHYTGSAPHACALAMDKALAKERVAKCGVPVARGLCLLAGKRLPEEPPLPLPLVLKPVNGGSSIGLSVITTHTEWRALPIPTVPLLCEGHLPGREYSVGVLDGCALPAVEICPVGGRYDYAHKYTAGATRELCPAPLTDGARERVAEMAITAFSALGLRDYARLDFKEDAAGVPIFLEANTLPGMTKTSLFPLAASVVGREMGVLCEEMALLAAKRRRGC